MQVEFFDATGKVVRTVSNTGRSLAVNVSCAQTGSTGADKGYIIGQAVN
ncbi:hypothetical protein ANCDUO_10285 [Ancylostoma duodenale]|uniref:Uncharacterized protein n=1 Tax=Ancylostoma duodenale TaxID=51022 RepID=A0A0C2GKS5_9BILA|nr:hypothetical protein ANCDUO_10285 [Ancylostoma duodenale]